MELRAYLTILWRRRWLIAVTTVVTFAVVTAGTLMMPPKFEASATLRIVPAIDASGNRLGWDDIQYGERLVNTYREIVTSTPVLTEMVRRLGLEQPPLIEVEIPANSELMRISVEDPNPLVAAKAANTLADLLMAQVTESNTRNSNAVQGVLSERLAQLEIDLNLARQTHHHLLAQSPPDIGNIEVARRVLDLKQEAYLTVLEQYEQARLSNTLQPNIVSVIELANTPRLPAKPRWALNLALGLIVGLVGGLGLAFLFENLDTTLYTTPQIEVVTQLSTLGRIPTTSPAQGSASLNAHPAVAEAFHRLRTNIASLSSESPTRTLMVTSAEPGEGKSTVVAHLAISLAQFGQKIIVVDANLRRPTLHLIFDLPNQIGLSNILNHETGLADAIQVQPATGLHILTSGPRPPNPAVLLGSPQMATLVAQLKDQYERVLLDTPAYLKVTDAVVLAPAIEAIALVVRRGCTGREALEMVLQQLTAVQAKVMGLVVNEAERGKELDPGFYTDRFTPAASPTPARPPFWPSLSVNFPRLSLVSLALLLGALAVVSLATYWQLNPAGASAPADPSAAEVVPSVVWMKTATADTQFSMQATVPTNSLFAAAIEIKPQSIDLLPVLTTPSPPDGDQPVSTLVRPPVSSTGETLFRSFAGLESESSETPTLVLTVTPRELSGSPSRTASPPWTQTLADTAVEPVTPQPGPPLSQTTSPLVTHIVAAGETPLSIATEYGIKVEDLTVANSIDDPASLRVGQNLLIPVAGTPTGSPSSPPDPPNGTFILLGPSPLDYDSPSYGPTDFEWIWDGPVPPDLGFEVRVWREGESPVGVHDAASDNRSGRVEKIDETRYRLSVNIQDILGPQGVYPRPSGQYFWTVGLVRVLPDYADLGERYWSQPTQFRFEAVTGSSRNAGESGRSEGERVGLE